jgi:hypothetical protein
MKPTTWPGGIIAIRIGCKITYHFWAETRGQEESIDPFFYFITDHSGNDYNFRDGTFNFKQSANVRVIVNSKYLYYYNTKCLAVLAS